MPRQSQVRPPRASTSRRLIDDDLASKPTTQEYAVEAVKQVLSILEAVAQEIPVPGVAAIVKTGVYLIRACDDSHVPLERAQELKFRIQSLIFVLVNELKGKKVEEIEEKFKEDIDSLQDALLYIQKKLDGIITQGSFRLVFFKSLNEEKVRKCSARLNNALEVFHLTRELGQTNKLNQLAKQILAFHEAHGQSLARIEGTLNNVASILEHHLPKSAVPQTRSRTVPPANSDIFHGRGSLVAELVYVLTGATTTQTPARLCILGPGGMGKTATALAVTAHPELAKQFPVACQVWVPCVQATTNSLFLSTLYSSLGMAVDTGNALNDILSELKSSGPLVLLLDNFETPWNIEGGRSETEQTLRAIHRISHIALVVTMRSSTPPCEGIRWHSIDLTAVDSNAALQIYSEIHPDGSTDPDLPRLLQVIGNMPLAIILMAKSGRLNHMPAAKLMEEYEKIGTRMLAVGSDAEHNLDICISLSVDSAPMKQHPEALNLLATLAMLPAGTTYDVLTDFWASGLENCPGSLQVLQETSLVQHQQERFHVHPVVRRYILHPSRFPDHIRASVVQSTCDFMKRKKMHLGYVPYKLIRAMSGEEGNVESILLETTIATKDIVTAMLKLAKYQQSTRPRLNVIQRALELVLALNDPELYADVTHEYGHICMRLGREEEARSRFQLAREAYIAIPNMSQAAECLLHIVRAGTLLKDVSTAERKEFIATALSEFEHVKGKVGVGHCNIYLGCQYIDEEKYSEAIQLFEAAKLTFVEVGASVPHIAEADFYVAEGHYRAKEYEIAEKCAISSSQAALSVGFYVVYINAIRTIAAIRIWKGDYDGALQVLTDCLECCKIFGSSLYIGYILAEIGRAHAKLGNIEEARITFQETLQVCSDMGTAKGIITRCKYFLRKLDNRACIPTKEEQEILHAEYPFDLEDLL